MTSEENVGTNDVVDAVDYRELVETLRVLVKDFSQPPSSSSSSTTCTPIAEVGNYFECLADLRQSRDEHKLLSLRNVKLSSDLSRLEKLSCTQKAEIVNLNDLLDQSKTHRTHLGSEAQLYKKKVEELSSCLEKETAKNIDSSKLEKDISLLRESLKIEKEIGRALLTDAEGERQKSSKALHELDALKFSFQRDLAEQTRLLEERNNQLQKELESYRASSTDYYSIEEEKKRKVLLDDHVLNQKYAIELLGLRESLDKERIKSSQLEEELIRVVESHKLELHQISFETKRFADGIKEEHLEKSRLLARVADLATQAKTLSELYSKTTEENAGLTEECLQLRSALDSEIRVTTEMRHANRVLQEKLDFESSTRLTLEENIDKLRRRLQTSSDENLNAKLQAENELIWGKLQVAMNTERSLLDEMQLLANEGNPLARVLAFLHSVESTLPPTILNQLRDEVINDDESYSVQANDLKNQIRSLNHSLLTKEESIAALTLTNQQLSSQIATHEAAANIGEAKAKAATEEAKAATEEAKAATEEAKAATEEAKAATEEANAEEAKAKAATEEAKAAVVNAKAAMEEAKAAAAKANCEEAKAKAATEEAKAAMEEAKAAAAKAHCEEAEVKAATEEAKAAMEEAKAAMEEAKTEEAKAKAAMEEAKAAMEEAKAAAAKANCEEAEAKAATEEAAAAKAARKKPKENAEDPMAGENVFIGEAKAVEIAENEEGNSLRLSDDTEIAAKKLTEALEKITVLEASVVKMQELPETLEYLAAAEEEIFHLKKHVNRLNAELAKKEMTTTSHETDVSLKFLSVGFVEEIQSLRAIVNPNNLTILGKLQKSIIGKIDMIERRGLYDVGLRKILTAELTIETKDLSNEIVRLENSLALKNIECKNLLAEIMIGKEHLKKVELGWSDEFKEYVATQKRLEFDLIQENKKLNNYINTNTSIGSASSAIPATSPINCSVSLVKVPSAKKRISAKSPSNESTKKQFELTIKNLELELCKINKEKDDAVALASNLITTKNDTLLTKKEVSEKQFYRFVIIGFVSFLGGAIFF